MKVVLASNNAGKINEFQTLVKELGIQLTPQAALGVPDIEETGLTFVENALLKARHACITTKLPAMSDDSGLEVAALNGAPGIYSARFAGASANAKDNIDKLLRQLEGVPQEQRQASFHCTLVYMAHAADPTPLICQGVWHGLILDKPRGHGGHGYDPVFYVPEEQCSAAELSLAQKNKLSHRGIALRLLLEKLPEKIGK